MAQARSRFGRGVILALALSAAAAGTTPRAPAQTAVDPPLPERRAILAADVDFPGNDIASLADVEAGACLRACLARNGCAAYTYNSRARACFLKSRSSAPVPYRGAVSGQVVETPAPVLARGRDRARELVALLGARALERVRALPEALALTHMVAPGTGAGRLRADLAAARASGNPAAMLRALGAGVVVLDDAGIWVEWARLALALADGRGAGAEADAVQEALDAAINGYLRAEAPELRARALLVAGAALPRLGRGRDAIGVLRLARALSPGPAVLAALDEAERRFGFRVVARRAEAESPEPRICAEFSEALAAGRDYGPFVRVGQTASPRAAAVVTAQGPMLCVEGVVHGETYSVSLRAGLPAASGETLRETVSFELLVPDRKPSVAFPGRGYVLPAAGELAVPVRTVNVERLALRLDRVSDRAIPQLLGEGLFGRPLEPWEAERLAETLAEPVWTGTGSVAMEPNRDVLTRLPLAGMTGALAPGVYVLRAGPEGRPPEDAPHATQWFVVSDLGLTTLRGSDGLHVFVLSLAGAAPVAGAELTLLSRGNAVLGQGRTDVQGHALFAPGLLAGSGGAAPAVVVARAQATGERAAERGVDLTFLPLTDPAFDLSDRGVTGRAPPGPLDVFVSTDRGVYRAGETIHATALLRDARAEAVDDVPLVAVLRRPDGAEYARQVSPPGPAGGHVLAFTTTDTAPRGGWRLEIHADPEAPPLAAAQLLIEDFLPERIALELSAPEGPLPAEGELPVAVAARHLFGAPAAGLAVRGEYAVRPVRSLAAWPGYRFGPEGSGEETGFEPIPDGVRTGADGRAHLALALAAPADSHAPLEAWVRLRISEASGRPVERSLTVPLAPAGPVIGVRPEFEGVLAEGSEAGFGVIALDRALRATALPVVWTLTRITQDYQWYRLDGQWRWEPVARRSVVARGRGTARPQPFRIAAPVAWGSYELRVESAADAPYAVATFTFAAGWSGAAAAGAAPDLLEVALDAERYRPGDIARLRLNAREAGTALVAVAGERLIEARAVPVVEPGPLSVDLPVTEAWGAGAHVMVSLVRPMRPAAGEGTLRAPARALGIAHAAIDPGARRLSAALDLPAEAAPRASLPVTLRVDGVAPGETAWATIAAVDVGILAVTRFAAPDPVQHYFGRRRLGMEVRDLYGRLIDGQTGALGEVRSGGDATAQAPAAPPSEALVALFAGPLPVGADGRLRTHLDLPAFDGTLRLMAIVWSKTGVGRAAADILVRDPVIVRASLPRFLAPADRARLLLEITHATGPAGRMELTVGAGGAVALAPGAAVPPALVLAPQATARLSVPVVAGERPGLGEIDIALIAPDGRRLERRLTLRVAENDPVVARTRRFDLAPGQGFAMTDELFAGLRPATATATVAAGAAARLDVPGLILALDRYPYGCTEQVTSRALPLLYLGELAAALGIDAGADGGARVEQAIRRVLDRQTGEGGFGLWSAQGGDTWLSAYVADFLARAHARGFAVPEPALRRAFLELRNRVNEAMAQDRADAGTAYALQVLAREGADVIADLRYVADARAGELGTPMALAQIAAALAGRGDRPRAERLFARAADLALADGPAGQEPRWRDDYGSALRDAAAVLALAAESGIALSRREALVRRLAAAPGGVGALSTQEQAWMLLAAHGLAGAQSAALTVNGVAPAAPVLRLAAGALARAPVALANAGAEPVTITLTAFGVAEPAASAGGEGMAIARHHFTLSGDPVDPARVAAGTRLVAVLTVQPFARLDSRLIVTDPLPAGFEIDNPSLLRSGDVAALEWLRLDAEPRHVEFRDDRFVAAVDWHSDQPFRLAYILRAVTPGQYHHPAASVEDMYRPRLRAHGATGRVEVVE